MQVCRQIIDGIDRISERGLDLVGQHSWPIRGIRDLSFGSQKSLGMAGHL